MDFQQELELVEKELLELIIARLEENKLDAETAQKLAADFLQTLPIENHKELLAKLKQLGEKYSEVQEVYVDELKKSSEHKRNATLSHMRNAIQQGDIHSAISAAKSLHKEEHT